MKCVSFVCTWWHFGYKNPIKQKFSLKLRMFTGSKYDGKLKLPPTQLETKISFLWKNGRKWHRRQEYQRKSLSVKDLLFSN